MLNAADKTELKIQLIETGLRVYYVGFMYNMQYAIQCYVIHPVPKSAINNGCGNDDEHITTNGHTKEKKEKKHSIINIFFFQFSIFGKSGTFA